MAETVVEKVVALAAVMVGEVKAVVMVVEEMEEEMVAGTVEVEREAVGMVAAGRGAEEKVGEELGEEEREGVEKAVEVKAVEVRVAVEWAAVGRAVEEKAEEEKAVGEKAEEEKAVVERAAVEKVVVERVEGEEGEDRTRQAGPLKSSLREQANHVSMSPVTHMSTGDGIMSARSSNRDYSQPREFVIDESAPRRTLNSAVLTKLKLAIAGSETADGEAGSAVKLVGMFALEVAIAYADPEFEKFPRSSEEDPGIESASEKKMLTNSFKIPPLSSSPSTS